MFSHPLYEFKNNIKGYKGSVLIIGGSVLYTGAPYSSAVACFLTGSDLVYIFTSDEAIIPLKGLLPEAIVCNIKYQEWILDRVDICIFGTGLGIIDIETKKEIKKILEYLNKNNKMIIIDGDGIRNIELLGLKKYENVIFTPNINEAKFIGSLNNKQYAIFKGEKDRIISFDDKVMIVDCASCGKRCGGQGDLLCGILASLIIKLKEDTSGIEKISKIEKILNSMSLASKILRLSGYRAYRTKGVSTMQRDIIKEIPEAFKEIIFINKEMN
ncbi:ATP-dependent (S)-NAD(P)H-hydrate dehydratase (CARKD) [Vairimorpha necatrix]|uniref:ATP-dependent (S)-NAD(P)H-hydrate dehydratase n=1 Tax=Vairimorpha necatrix TaxID=6039 RepID=A0AAX4J992_9MICR